jgi:hypothetical protein
MQPREKGGEGRLAEREVLRVVTEELTRRAYDVPAGNAEDAARKIRDGDPEIVEVREPLIVDMPRITVYTDATESKVLLARTSQNEADALFQDRVESEIGGHDD